MLCCIGGQQQRQLQFRRCSVEITTKFGVGILRPVDEEHGIRCRAGLSAQALDYDVCRSLQLHYRAHALRESCGYLTRRYSTAVPHQIKRSSFSHCRTTRAALELWKHGTLG